MNNRDALIECSKHIKVAICTLGKEGAILYNEEKYHEVNMSADVIDTTEPETALLLVFYIHISINYLCKNAWLLIILCSSSYTGYWSKT